MVDATPLNRGSLPVQSIPNGGSLVMDAACVPHQTVVVQVDMNGGASGDLAVAVVPIQEDGVSPLPIALVGNPLGGPTFAAGKVQYYGRFDVRGINKIRITLTNNNAAPQTLNRATWFGSGDDT